MWGILLTSGNCWWGQRWLHNPVIGQLFGASQPLEVEAASENTGGKINYIWCLLEYFCLWIIENSSLNSKKSHLTWSARLGIQTFWEGQHLSHATENQALSVFHSLSSGFCPHGDEMALHRPEAIPKKVGRGCLHILIADFLRAFFLASHWSKLCHMAYPSFS